jgi:hypothetical protein
LTKLRRRRAAITARRDFVPKSIDQRDFVNTTRENTPTRGLGLNPFPRIEFFPEGLFDDCELQSLLFDASPYAS